MQRRFGEKGHIPIDLKRRRLPDEEVAVGISINQLAVLGIDGIHADADVRLAHAKVDHELAKRLWPDAPAAHGPHSWNARIVPSGILACLDGLSQFAGAKRSELMNLDSPPVNDPRILPAQIIVKISLPAPAVRQILAAQNMRCAEQVVFHRRLKIEKRPDAILRSYQRMRGSDDAKSRPVANGRVLVVHVGLNSQDRIALGQSAVEHLLPQLQVLLHTLISMLALHSLVLMLLEDCLRTGAYIRPTPAYQLLCYRVILAYPFAGSDNQIRPGVKPCAVLKIPAVSLRHGPLLDRIGVIEADDELAPIFPDVFGVDDNASRAAECRRPVGIGRKAHHYPIFCPLQSR
ncbi:Uncharacterised protein [uncultured archaeon]|nr:Uncharacterised protein [uncultured archaeon]